MPHPEVTFELSRSSIVGYTSGAVPADILNQLSHLNDSPAVQGLGLREFVVSQAHAHLQSNPKADHHIVTVPESTTRYKIVFV